MDDKAQISVRHLWAMTVVNTLGGTLLALPAIAVEAGGRATWVVVTLAGIIGFLTVLLVGKLGQRFPKLTFVGIASKITSNWLGKLLGLIMSLLLTLNVAMDLRVALKSVLGVYFFSTPLWAIATLLALTSLSAAWFGVVNMSRLGPVFLALLSLTFLFTFPLLWRWMQLGYLIPLLDFTQIDFGYPLWPALSSFRSGLLLMAIMPYTAEPRRAVRTYGWAFWIGWLAVLPAVIAPILIFGPEGAKAGSVPFLFIVSIIRLPNLPLERVEMFARLAYNMNVLYTVGAIYFTGGLLLSDVFGTRWIRPFMLAMAAVSVILLVLVRSDKTVEDLSAWVLTVTMCFTWATSLLLWLIARIRGVGQR